MVIHTTNECTEPSCTISYPHGHDCPLCGTGVYRLPELDESSLEGLGCAPGH